LPREAKANALNLLGIVDEPLPRDIDEDDVAANETYYEADSDAKGRP
jgi:hypothetical protein